MQTKAMLKPSQFFKGFVLFFSITFLANCSLLSVEETSKAATKSAPSERQLIYDKANGFFKAEKYEEAERFYFQITRYPPDGRDEIYDKALFDLASLYEKTDQSEKAILALDELFKRDSSTIDKASVKVLLIKNHYRVTNYYQARIVRSKLDDLYRSQEVSLADLYTALYYQTNLYYDRHVFDELSFIGDMQKYFVYVMESSMSNEAEKLTELLMLYYERFDLQLNKSILSTDIKKRLIILLIDQLNRFDRYQLNDSTKNITYLNRFSTFAENLEKKLTERLTNGNY